MVDQRTDALERHRGERTAHPSEDGIDPDGRLDTTKTHPCVELGIIEYVVSECAISDDHAAGTFLAGILASQAGRRLPMYGPILSNPKVLAPFKRIVSLLNKVAL